VIGKLTDRRSRRALDVAERFADGSASQEEVSNVREMSVLHRRNKGIEHAATLSLGAKPHLAGAWLIRAIDPFESAETASEERGQADLLRDIFGNPFRPVTFDPAWRTPTVVALASQMYESRDFGAMPILADALQDAGWESEDVLNHCRSGGVHVSGCWVVDLVLGKE
jgi:hypothetical protein